MGNWNASNYRQRKAERQSKVKPRWVTNPETGEKFYLRPVRAIMSSVLAGSLPSGLAEETLAAWKEQDVQGLEEPSAQAAIAQLSPTQIQESARETQRLSIIIQEACVVPLISNEAPDAIVFSDEWQAQAFEGLKELDAEFTIEKFNPKSNVVNPRDLDENDTRWLFRWAAGLVLDVEMKGGETMPIGSVSRFPKKLNRRPRARADGKELRKAS